MLIDLPETEDYLLLRTKQHSVDEVTVKKVPDGDTDALIEGIGNIALDQVSYMYLLLAQAA